MDLLKALLNKDVSVAAHVGRIGKLLKRACTEVDSAVGVTPADPFTAALNKPNTRGIEALLMPAAIRASWRWA